MDENHKLRYPVGEFFTPSDFSHESIVEWIRVIEEFPGKLRSVALALGEDNLKKQYRPEGWTGNQVIHHLADSHMNAFIRMKLALTEDVPSVKPYIESRWAELPDANDHEIELSLNILKSLHARWVKFLRSLEKSEFELTYFHPEYGKEYTLAEALAMYAWHCRHHLAHLELIKN